jgi:uncharacterized membrane protein YcaP (DUF421 family)
MDLHQLIGRHGHDITALQMSARAAVVFVLGLVLVRVAGKRVFGRWDALDIILSVVIGSNLGRAITGGAALGPTLAACVVLVALHWAFAWAAVAWPPLGALFKGQPVRLITDGDVDRRAMKRSGIGEEDLEQALRAAGVTETREVKAAYIERSGRISIVR